MSLVQKLLRNFIAADCGGVAVTSALSAVAITGAAGLATLYIQMVDAETVVQSSLDAAVLGATAMPYSTKADARIAMAAAIYKQNVQGAAGAGQASFDATSNPTFTVLNANVSGSATASVNNTLAVALGISTLKTVVSSAAVRQQSNPICVLTLSRSQPSTVEIYGNATLAADGCAVLSNSSNGTGIKIYGTKSSASASQFGVNGGYSGDTWTPQPITAVSRVEDPFADVPFPTPEPCMNVSSRLGQGSYTLNPGTYCGGLRLGAHANVTLNPGVYTMLDGTLSIGSGAKVQGEEVMIAFGGRDSYLHALSGAEMNLTSPRTGTYKNMQFMSDRDLSQSKFNQEWATILGGAKLKYDGVMYLPEQQVWMSGKDHDIIIDANSPTLGLVVDKLWVQGNAFLSVSQLNKRNIDGLIGPVYFEHGAVLVK